MSSSLIRWPRIVTSLLTPFRAFRRSGLADAKVRSDATPMIAKEKRDAPGAEVGAPASSSERRKRQKAEEGNGQRNTS